MTGCQRRMATFPFFQFSIFLPLLAKLLSMIFIRLPRTDPFFNLAAEEYILRNSREDVLMLWQNEPSVVVGKHQNVVAEVNMDFVRENNIPVIRRISGGGTVYHDLGNINITQITTSGKQENLIDFRKFSQPVMDFLKQFGLKAAFEGKNNLVVNGKKFSGNSAHVFKNKVMHHGTLLYSTDLERLEKVIHPGSSHIVDKSIKSIRATVGNIADFLEHPVEISVFKARLEQFLIGYYHINKILDLSGEEQKAIEKLVQEKYRKWEWNMGYSPKYAIAGERDTEYGKFQVDLHVREGKITDIALFFEGKKLEKIEQKLLGQKHDKVHLRKILADNRFSEVIINTLF